MTELTERKFDDFVFKVFNFYGFREKYLVAGSDRWTIRGAKLTNTRTGEVKVLDYRALKKDD